MDNHLFWYLGKLAASCAVAGSAVLLFWVAARFLQNRSALLISLAYGLGTCVWSISSQTLWQHGPNEFFLALGSFFYLRSSDWAHLSAAAAADGHAQSVDSGPGAARDSRNLFWSGLAFGLAVLCRPTSAVAVIIMMLWLLASRPKALVPFCLGGLPVALLIGLYNWHFFGTTFAFGQIGRGPSIALEKTGSAELWQTPLWHGIAGLLFSPSRGLFIFSPFLVFSILGIWSIWREKKYAALRPLTLVAPVMLIIASKWFDWWGGWTYGYRPIVDTTPFLALGLIPAVPWIREKRVRLAVFACVLVFSVLAQIVGAFAFDLVSWNSLDGKDIDKPANRARLWSWRDNEIGFYMAHFSECRLMKQCQEGL